MLQQRTLESVALNAQRQGRGVLQVAEADNRCGNVTHFPCHAPSGPLTETRMPHTRFGVITHRYGHTNDPLHVEAGYVGVHHSKTRPGASHQQHRCTALRTTKRLWDHRIGAVSIN
jgi:hypothetical protein